MTAATNSAPSSSRTSVGLVPVQALIQVPATQPPRRSVAVVRPAPPGASPEQALPVDLDAIVKRGDTTTNYQILPGDRVIVERPEPSPGGSEKAEGGKPGWTHFCPAAGSASNRTLTLTRG